MRILGVDPGLSVTGYGIIDSKGQRDFCLVEGGVIKTSRVLPLEARLQKIYESIVDIIENLRPQVIVLEKLYSHYKHPTTAILMGHVRGVVSLAANQKKIPLCGYSSTRINKAIIGEGHASKERIQRMVQKLLGLKNSPRSTDLTDALALAIGHVYLK